MGIAVTGTMLAVWRSVFCWRTMPYERKRVSSFRYWARKKDHTEQRAGDGGNAIGFVPKNELNVREVFAQRAERLGFRILESRVAFPDYVLEQRGRRVLAEAEFRTSDFLRHRHDIGRCDLIVIWEHDLPYMPVPILELTSEKTHRPRRGRPPSRFPRP